MKKIFILLLVFTFISCQKNEKIDSSIKLETKIDSSEIIKQEAFKILDTVNLLVKKGITKELSNDVVNSKINPLMEKYNNLLTKLNKIDSTEVQNYRIQEINKIIDLQIQNE
jgi:hypothetical protein